MELKHIEKTSLTGKGNLCKLIEILKKINFKSVAEIVNK